MLDNSIIYTEYCIRCKNIITNEPNSFSFALNVLKHYARSVTMSINVMSLNQMNSYPELIHRCFHLHILKVYLCQKTNINILSNIII